MAMNINLNKIRNLPSNIQIFILSIPSVILILLFVFLVFLPKYKEIKALNAKIAKLNQDIESSEAMVKKLDILIEENKALNAKLAKFKKQLPEEKEVSELLKQISTSGLKAGLEILLWKPEAKKTSPDNLYVEIPVKVEVRTGYHNLGVFFSDVSRLPRLVNISDLDLRVKDQKNRGPQELITAAFTARTFASVSPGETGEMKDQGTTGAQLEKK